MRAAVAFFPRPRGLPIQSGFHPCFGCNRISWRIPAGVNVRPPEAELFFKAVIVNPDEFVKVVFDTTIPARCLRISRSIDSRRLARPAFRCVCSIRHWMSGKERTGPWLQESLEPPWLFRNSSATYSEIARQTKCKQIPAFTTEGAPSRIKSNAENQKAFT